MKCVQRFASLYFSNTLRVEQRRSSVPHESNNHRFRFQVQQRQAQSFAHAGLSVDPGSKCTGLAITDSDNRIVQKIELHHRGKAIKKGLSDRAGYRRSRRTRMLRHRPPRFNNRSRKSPTLTENGWEYQSYGHLVFRHPYIDWL